MKSNSEISQKAYAGNDAGIATVMGELMLAHYRRVYQAFDGDLMLAMILAEIAQCAGPGARRTFPGMPTSRHMYAENRLKPVNTLSLSQSCAIPRETLRRKIRTLIDAPRLIRKNTDGSLHVTEQCMARFGTDFNLALLKDIRTCAARLEGLLDEDGT